MEEDRNLFLFHEDPSWNDWGTYKMESKCNSGAEVKQKGKKYLLESETNI